MICSFYIPREGCSMKLFRFLDFIIVRIKISKELNFFRLVCTISFASLSRFPFPSHGRHSIGASARPSLLRQKEPQFEQGIRSQRAQDARQERRPWAKRRQLCDCWSALEGLGYAGSRRSRNLLTSTFGTLGAVSEATRGTIPV